MYSYLKSDFRSCGTAEILAKGLTWLGLDCAHPLVFNTRQTRRYLALFILEPCHLKRSLQRQYYRGLAIQRGRVGKYQTYPVRAFQFQRRLVLAWYLSSTLNKLLTNLVCLWATIIILKKKLQIILPWVYITKSLVLDMRCQHGQHEIFVLRYKRLASCPWGLTNTLCSNKARPRVRDSQWNRCLSF